MKFIICLLYLMIIGIIADNNNDTAKPTTKEKSTKESTLCSSCHCDTKYKTLDCSHLKLFDLFAEEDWTQLATDSPAVTKIILFNNNNIKTVTAMPTLDVEELNLSNNKIEKIDDLALKNLQKLVTLDLSHNLLTSKGLTPKGLDGLYNADNYEPLKQLKILRLSYNHLHTLNIDLFEHLPALEELYLDGNPFQIIDHSTEIAISSVPHLKILDMSYLEIASLPIHIFHSPRELVKLNLTGNFFTQIPLAIQYAVNLEHLTLDENFISTVDSENPFPPLKKLKTLEFSYLRKLSIIGKGGLSNLISLTSLDISHNPNLTYIDGQAICTHGQENTEREEWPPIVNLHLDNNNLTYLDSHLLARWDILTTIEIHNNPWSCDCDNQWMIDTLVPMMANNTPQFMNRVTCATPIEMKDLNLGELAEKHSHLRCPDKYGNRPERDGAILISILIGVLIGIPLALGVLWVYRNGCFGLMAPRGPGDYSRAFYKRTGNQEDFHI